jgi:hypothetical protein
VVRTLPLAGPVVSATAVAAAAAMWGLRDPALVLVVFVAVALGTALGTRRLDLASRSDAEQIALARRSTVVCLAAGGTVIVLLLALLTLV